MFSIRKIEQVAGYIARFLFTDYRPPRRHVGIAPAAESLFDLLGRASPLPIGVHQIWKKRRLTATIDTMTRLAFAAENAIGRCYKHWVCMHLGKA